jgi:hypothetical protein
MRPSDLVARSLVDTLPSFGKSLGSGAGGGKPAKQMAAEHQAWLDAQPMKVKCAHCRWWRYRPAAEAVALAEAHRLEAHPELGLPTRGRRARELQRVKLLAARRAEDSRARARVNGARAQVRGSGPRVHATATPSVDKDIPPGTGSRVAVPPEPLETELAA